MIYEHWFVQFDFPDANGKPYKSSGGAMVWNEELKQEVPDGWDICRLRDVCSLRNGVNYEKNIQGDKNYRIVNVRNITNTTLLLQEYDFDLLSLPQHLGDNYLLTDKDIVIARSGSPGATRLLLTPCEDVIFCGFIICLTPSDIKLRLFLTFLLKSLEGTSATKSGGSILKNVSQDTLKGIISILPPDKILIKFNTTISMLFEQMAIINREINFTTQLRDWLLPMLMNGQIKVLE